jgi:hypothetical protein
MRARGIRVIAIRRDLETHHRESTPGARLVHVVAGRPGRTTARAWRRTVGDLHQVVTATESLASDGVTGSGWEDEPEPYALVCTNGRHDVCCATSGRPVVRALRRSPWAEWVWECSHIGGDRFAGNLLLLPESLYFGRCDEAGAEEVLTAFDQGRIALAHYRGRSTQSLVEQAAEHFVRARYSLDALDALAGVESLGNGRVAVRLAGDGAAERLLVVTVERTHVPASTPLTCKGAEGLTYPAFGLVAIDESAD